MADELIPFQEEEKSGASIKEILATIKVYWAEIRQNWKLVAYIAGGLTTLLVILALTTKTTYTATLTFMVDDGSDGGGGAATAILGALGISKPSDTNLDKIVALSKSRAIVAQAMFEKDSIGGKLDYFANHFIREYEFQKKWAKRGNGMENFVFTSADVDKFDRKNNAAMLAIYTLIVGTVDQPGLFLPAYTATSGILNLKLTTTKEQLSLDFLDVMFHKLSDYYILKNIAKEQLTYTLVKAQTDSLRRVIKNKAYGAAQFTDRSEGLLFSYNQMPGVTMQQDASLAADIYGRALANLALADYALKDNRPYVEAIDMPIPPLKGVKPSLLMQLIIGIIGGGILGALFVAGRKKYREFIATLKEGDED